MMCLCFSKLKFISLNNKVFLSKFYECCQMCELEISPGKSGLEKHVFNYFPNDGTTGLASY